MCCPEHTLLEKLKKGSKEWWRLNRELLDKKSKCSSIPPLRDQDAWVNGSKEKANLFAQTFHSKAQLPAETVDCPFFGNPDAEFEDFVALRSRQTLKELKKLDVNKATGPDRLPAVLLKSLAKSLAVPLTMLCRRLLHDGCWPQIWRLHHIGIRFVFA